MGKKQQAGFDMKRTSYEDLAKIREAMRGYAQYRKSKGLPPTDLWLDRVTDGLVEQGFPVKRRPKREREPGED